MRRFFGAECLHKDRTSGQQVATFGVKNSTQTGLQVKVVVPWSELLHTYRTLQYFLLSEV